MTPAFFLAIWEDWDFVHSPKKEGRRRYSIRRRSSIELEAPRGRKQPNKNVTVYGTSNRKGAFLILI